MTANKLRSRLDYFLNDALAEFGEWLKTSAWRGKEHDVVNVFVSSFLLPRVADGAAIRHPGQIRIQGAVKQIERNANPAVVKDLVIWDSPMANAWDDQWRPVNTPRAVLEWKAYREPRRESFDAYDTAWIGDWTAANPGTIGYVVTARMYEPRGLSWLIARGGKFRNEKSV
jgi:hypothetical protein